MRNFVYSVTDEVGIHARPAGIIAKKAKEYESDIVMECKGKKASASKLMALMALGVKCGDEITVSVSGGDEDKAAEEFKDFLKSNL